MLISLCVVAVCVFSGFGLFHLLYTVRHSRNKCTMTYMWPNYYPIELPSSRLKYELFQYSHSAMDNEDRTYKSGKAVLFVPGNAGSHGQVRSIGKEIIAALDGKGHRKSEIAVYSLDFNEELSGLSGGLLSRHVEFTGDAISEINKLHVDAEILAQRAVLVEKLQGARRALKLLKPPVSEAEETIDVLHTHNTSFFAPLGILTIEDWISVTGTPKLDESIVSSIAISSVDKVVEHITLLKNERKTFDDNHKKALQVKHEIKDDLAQLKLEHHNKQLNFQLIVVGHSMGGVVGRLGLLQVSPTLQQSVTAFISLSSPLSNPVIGADFQMYRLYEEMHRVSDKNRTYLSIAGGYRDTLVKGELTKFKVSSNSASVGTFGLVGISNDHVSILWCNEVVLQISDAIFKIFQGQSKLVLDKFKKVKNPKRGFMQKEQIASSNFLTQYFADVIARKHLPRIPLYAMSLCLVMLAHVSGASTRTVVMWAGVTLLPFGRDVFVPVIMSALGVTFLVMLNIITWGIGYVARRIHQYGHVIGFTVASLIFFRTNGLSFPSNGDIIVMLVFSESICLLVLIICGFSIRIFSHPIDADSLKCLYANMYLVSLAGWIGVLVFNVNVLSSIYRPVLSSVEVMNLMFSVLLMVPVHLHMYLLQSFPRYTSEEKVLDSVIERIREPEPAVAIVPPEQSEFLHSGDSSPCHIATEGEQGKIQYHDAISAELITFKNKEVVQMDEILNSGTKSYHANAVNLIEVDEKLSSISCFRVERVRLGNSIVCQNKPFQVVCLVIAFVFIQLSSSYMFVLSLFAPLLSLYSIKLREDSHSQEIVRRTKL